MKLKYVRHSVAGFILWPVDIDLYYMHIGRVADRETQGHVISAGFCTLVNGVRCFGKSESLGIGSRPEDAALLSQQIGIPEHSSEATR